MSEKKYYCFCESNCRYETLTKEQILTAIEQAIRTGKIKDVDTGFVTTVKDRDGNGIGLWFCKTAAYNAAVASGVDLTNVLCFLTDDTTEEDILTDLEDLGKRIAAAEGFGLGGVSKYAKDCDAAFENGWYYTDANSKNIPVGNSLGIMLVCNRDAGEGTRNVFQLYVSANGGYMLKREYYNAAWREWAYLNPPLLMFTEYKTTEFFLGKPVYTMNVHVGAIGQGEEKTVEHGATNVGTVVSCMLCDNGSGTNYTHSKIIEHLGATRSYVKVAVASGAANGLLDAYVTIKYTKSND